MLTEAEVQRYRKLLNVTPEVDIPSSTKRRGYSGGRKPKVILSDDDVRLIRQLYRDGISQPDIARSFNCSRQHINQICTRRRYPDVSDTPPAEDLDF